MPEEKESQFTTISIPTSLYKKIEERIDDEEFTSVSAYVTFVLNEVLSDEEDDVGQFSEEDEEKVKERLRSLGYLD